MSLHEPDFLSQEWPETTHEPSLMQVFYIYIFFFSRCFSSLYSPFLPSSTRLWVLVLHLLGSPAGVCFQLQWPPCCPGHSVPLNAPWEDLRSWPKWHSLRELISINMICIRELLDCCCTYDVHFGRQRLRVSLRNKGIITGIMNSGALNVKVVIPVSWKESTNEKEKSMETPFHHRIKKQ